MTDVKQKVTEITNNTSTPSTMAEMNSSISEERKETGAKRGDTLLTSNAINGLTKQRKARFSTIYNGVVLAQANTADSIKIHPQVRRK